MHYPDPLSCYSASLVDAILKKYAGSAITIPGPSQPPAAILVQIHGYCISYWFHCGLFSFLVQFGPFFVGKHLRDGYYLFMIIICSWLHETIVVCKNSVFIIIIRQLFPFSPLGAVCSRNSTFLLWSFLWWSPWKWLNLHLLSLRQASTHSPYCPQKPPLHKLNGQLLLHRVENATKGKTFCFHLYFFLSNWFSHDY